MSDAAKELLGFMFQNVGQISERDLWRGVEALQAYTDELNRIENNPPVRDDQVTCRVKEENIAVRFKDTDDMARWISDYMNRTTP